MSGNAYRLSPDRQLTEEEQKLIWRKPASHQVSEQEQRISSEIKRNWNRGEMKIANILLEGDAGSGKTQLAKALSANFGLPYTKVTCFADMDKSDIIGSILPVVDTANEDNSSDQIEYRFYPSEIVRAYTNGYVLEIQEPTMIRDAAVLMALNSALELDGSLNLPTEVVRRHPDFIAIITTNRSYAGVRPLNEALRDRVQHAEKMELPEKAVMIERAMAKTGYRNRRMLDALATAIIVLDQTARAHAMKGVAGMRSFFYWTDAVASGASPGESLYPKVIYKITTHPEEIAILEEALSKQGIAASLEEAANESATEPAADAESEVESVTRRRSADDAVEIKTWGRLDHIDASSDQTMDEEAIALKKAAESEDGSSGASEHDSVIESADLGEDGKPQYQANIDPKTMADKQKTQQYRRKLNQEARAAVSDSMHSKVKLIVHRPEYDADNEREYASLYAELMPVVREIAAKTLPLLEHDDSVELMKNRYYGSKFQADRIVNRDFKVFAKKHPPTESPTLAVGIRVDESASMSAYGRLEAAKRAVLAVYEFCQLCRIPVLIHGDTADASKLEQMSIFVYADFEQPDAGDRYRLMRISARSNNRDGMALRLMAQRLTAAPQRTKLILSLSDGRPKAMDDYTGSYAENDMRQTIEEYERKGITFLAAAIGQDKEEISRIYGAERFLDMTNLDELPAQLVRIIARYM